MMPYMSVIGVFKNKSLDSELALWFFTLFDMSESTKKNFSSLAYLECPPLMTFHYTKEIPKDTKEKSQNRKYQFLALN